MPVPVPVSVPARTLPNLQVSHIPTYLPTVCRNHLSRESFIHSFIHPLPSSLPSGCRLSICLYLYLCVYTSVYLRVSVRVHVHTYSTHKRYISKDTYQRYISKIHVHVCLGVCGCFFVFLKIYLPIRSTQKNHPTNVRAPALSFTNFTRWILCASQSKFSLSNWRPKTTVCLASYLR